VLETGELLGEPLPSRAKRNAILLYEASEGGAGVLKRLMAGAEPWRTLGACALDLMHLERCDGGNLVDRDDSCKAGCYRCLLSYYNQPDHELIERRDTNVQTLLDTLARCDAVDRALTVGDAADPWLVSIQGWGVPNPIEQTIAGVCYPLCWPNYGVMAVVGAAPPSLASRCADLGRDLIELPQEPGVTIPSALASALGVAV
jgi:hypothetical protein